MEWFYYDGTGSFFEPLNYSPIAIPICPQPKQRLCAIRAVRQLINGRPRPMIAQNLQTEINTALSSLTESANVLLQPN